LGGVIAKKGGKRNQRENREAKNKKQDEEGRNKRVVGPDRRCKGKKRGT